MKINKHVKSYISDYKNGKILLNKRRILLIKYLKSSVFNRKDLYFDEKHIDNCIKFIEKFYFRLEPFQKFLVAFVFLYRKNGMLFFDEFLIMMARGGGKNGFISGIADYLSSSLHGVKNYDISIIANSERQAKTSFLDITKNISENDVLKDYYYYTKQEIRSLDTNSIIRYHASNSKTADGYRPGCLIFDEIHMYEDDEVVRVFSSGLGKVNYPRKFYLTTNGHVRDGFLDELMQRVDDVFSGQQDDGGLFPFVCELDSESDYEDIELWEKAQPMFCKPLSDYAKILFNTVLSEFKKLPNGRVEFMTKRMNMPISDMGIEVASREAIMNTKQKLPDVTGHSCIGGVDYASINDFCAVGLLFKVGEQYIWITHTFVCADVLKRVKIKAPIEEWAEQGLLTILDEPTIGVEHIASWFDIQRHKYSIEKIVADNFRLDLIKPALERFGFECDGIRNPKAIQGLVAPKVTTILNNGKLILGDNPLMRWYIQNTCIKQSGGNPVFAKKEQKTRKTDGFHAFIHALYQEASIESADLSSQLEFLNAIF